MTRDEGQMRQCWANRDHTHARCLNRVPLNPEHIGLCDQHLALFRDPEFTRQAVAA